MVAVVEWTVVLTALEHLKQSTVVPLMEEDCATGKYIKLEHKI